MVDLMWAEVGERLHLTVTEMRSIRTTFGDTLGLQTSKRVPEELVPVIGVIANLRREGIPDKEIERRLKEAGSGGGWPEEVLARMQTAACAVPRTWESVAEEVSRHLHQETVPAPGTPDASLPDSGAEHEPYADSSVPTLAVRNMITNLRAEICSQSVEQREILHRMNQLLQDLVLEVRDLRWAIILSSSRKERKRGKRTITKLLSG